MIECKTQTPWGKAQFKSTITRGINRYITASHGGYRVSKKLNESIPAHLRNEDGWYEEDCEWAKVVIAFPQHFDITKLKQARSTLKEWFWPTYEVHYNITLAPGESTRKDKYVFLEANRDKFQAVAAFGSWHKMAKPGYVVVIVRKPSTGEEKTIHVPEADYDKRSETYGYFIVNKNYEEFRG